MLIGISEVLLRKYIFGEYDVAFLGACSTVALIIGFATVTAFSSKIGSHQMLKVGIYLQYLGVLVYLLALLTPLHDVPLVLIAVSIPIVGLGVVTPTAVALAMSRSSENSGTASAVLGSMQLLGAGIGALFGSWLSSRSQPFQILLAEILVLAILMHFVSIYQLVGKTVGRK